MFHQHHLLTFLLIISQRCSGKSSLPAVSYLLVTRVGPCAERKVSELVYVSEMSLLKERHDSSLSGELSITGHVDNGWHIKATMQKCHDIRNLDTCDFYKSVAIIRNGCLESEEADVYNMFFQYITPKLECPVQPGNYTINEFPFFTEDSDLTTSESKISTSVFGYTYRLEGYNEDDERLLCVDAQLLLNYVRERDWTGGRKIGAGVTAQPSSKKPARNEDVGQPDDNEGKPVTNLEDYDE